MRILTFLFQILFRRRCRTCNAPGARAGYCDECWERIRDSYHA